MDDFDKIRVKRFGLDKIIEDCETYINRNNESNFEEEESRETIRNINKAVQAAQKIIIEIRVENFGVEHGWKM